MERTAPTSERAALCDLLTQTQVRILQLFADGLTKEEIGLELGLSAKTIKSYKSKIGEKGGEDNSKKTIARFIINGIDNGWINHSIGEDEVIEPLTRRQFEVAILYAFGNSREEIGAKLSISPQYAGNQVAEVRRRLSARPSVYGAVSRIAYLFANGMLRYE